MMGPLVYILCASMCWLCAILLLRAYASQKGRLLFWSGAAFCAFGVSNVLLFVDLVLLPENDLSLVRNCVTLLGICLLMRGLIWESSSR
jgi:hypothetical protein